MIETAIRRIEIGRRIRETRKKKGITQAALAEAIGVRQGTLSAWERGGVDFRLNTLEAIAAALGVKMAKLTSESRP